MAAATAGLVGALVGLALGFLQYFMAGSVAEKRMKAAPDEELAPEHKEAFQRQVAFVRRLLFWSSVMVYPVVGYVIGRSLGAR
jgi:hypothetical protein